jgi:hypothetical protein
MGIILRLLTFSSFLCQNLSMTHWALFPLWGKKPLGVILAEKMLYRPWLVIDNHRSAFIPMKWRGPWIQDWEHQEVNRWLHAFLPSLTCFILTSIRLLQLHEWLTTKCIVFSYWVASKSMLSIAAYTVLLYQTNVLDSNRLIKYQYQAGMKILEKIQYQYQAGMKIFKRCNASIS